MGSIHELDREDDVSGQIVGSMLSVGFLSYAGKKQRGQIYAGSAAELIEFGVLLKQSIISDCGEAWSEIFPETSEWRLEIIQ